MKKFISVFIICLLLLTVVACRKNFTVKFDTGGGSLISTQTVEKGKTATLPTNPTKDGFDFLGWYLGEDEYDFSTPVNNNITLTARWKEREILQSFTVTFDTDGGSGVESQTVTKNGKLTLPSEPTKDGYEFIGWYLGETRFDFNTEITANLTLTAKWQETIIYYKVFFDSQGGEDIPFQSVESGKTAKEPEIPKKDGWLFLGWYEGESPFDFSKPIEKDTYITAKWQEIVTYYSVIFLSEGEEITSLIVAEGEKIEPLQIERDGYEFLGWYYDGKPFNFDQAVTDNIVLLAEWEKIEIESFRVTFVTNCEVILDTVSVESGESVARPNGLFKEGYNFLGWFLNEEEYDFSSPITEDIILIAKWEEIPASTFTVTFDSNGGSSVESQEVEENGYAKLPINPQKDGFEFIGWFLDEEEYDFSSPITEDITLIAHWEEVKDIGCLVGEWKGYESSDYAKFSLSLVIFEDGTGQLNYFNSFDEEIASYTIYKIEYIGEEVNLYLVQNQVVITLTLDGEKLVGKCIFDGETELVKQ